MNEILNRLLTQFGDMELVEKFSDLSNSDFNSLMLEIFQSRTNGIMPTEIVKTFQSNRFSVPSELNPVDYHILETEFLSTAQKLGIEPLLLSPAAPFASSSVFGCVNQNNVMSALRGTEILSDPTNMIAFIIAPSGCAAQTATDEPAAFAVLEDLDNLLIQHISSYYVSRRIYKYYQ